MARAIKQGLILWFVLKISVLSYNAWFQYGTEFTLQLWVLFYDSTNFIFLVFSHRHRWGAENQWQRLFHHIFHIFQCWVDRTQANYLQRKIIIWKKYYNFADNEIKTINAFNILKYLFFPQKFTLKYFLKYEHSIIFGCRYGLPITLYLMFLGINILKFKLVGWLNQIKYCF